MNAAAAMAVRREPSSRPIAHATPTRPTPARAEIDRSATSPVSKTRDHTQASTYQAGGEFSVCTTPWSVAPRLGRSTCTGVYASSYQKL